MGSLIYTNFSARLNIFLDFRILTTEVQVAFSSFGSGDIWIFELELDELKLFHDMCFLQVCQPSIDVIFRELLRTKVTFGDS